MIAEEITHKTLISKGLFTLKCEFTLHKKPRTTFEARGFACSSCADQRPPSRTRRVAVPQSPRKVTK